MSDDLLTLMRSRAQRTPDLFARMALTDGADEIERLQARVAELEAHPLRAFKTEDAATFWLEWD